MAKAVSADAGFASVGVGRTRQRDKKVRAPENDSRSPEALYFSASGQGMVKNRLFNSD